MYNNKYTRLITAISPALISFVSCILVYFFNIILIVIPSDHSFHFNLITVNALFGGFLYTNYSLLFGVLDHQIIKKVAGTNIIENRNSHILRGIVCATFSVISGLFIVLAPENRTGIIGFLYCLMINTEIVFMFFLILYFLLSLYEMNQLLSSIHKSTKKYSSDSLQQLKYQILNDDFDS